MMLVDGVLRETPKSADGKFRRINSGIRNWIQSEADAEFPAEAGRYHLYTSTACPGCHRTRIMRALKGLQDLITTTEMHSLMREAGWQIDTDLFDESAGVPFDEYVYQVYLRADPRYTGPISVPILYDKKTRRIVNNESADIMRMFNSAFEQIAPSGTDYYPADHRDEIDAISDLIYGPINAGVYRAGFATTQTAYDEAVADLFDTLDELDQRLSLQRYLVGNQITEADWRLFTTLIRFDAVYVTHFKTDRCRVVDYANLGPYLRELYQVPGIAGTIDMKRMREHYFHSHIHINPYGITAVGPALALTGRHGRENVGYQLGGAA